MELIDCKKVRAEILEEVKQEVAQIFADTGKQLTLKILQVLGDDASDVYIRNKLKTAESVGIKVEHITFADDVPFDYLQQTILKQILDVNANAVMLQLPLPDHLKPYQQDLLNTIPDYMDCDGLSVVSLGKLLVGEDCIAPATALGCVRVLESIIDLSGKNVVICGRSTLVGKPLVSLLEQKNCTVILCHSKTIDLKKYTQQADIVITAIGKAKYFDTSYFKDDAIVIDVGMNRDENGKLCGDVDIESLKDTNIKVTPTPGGSGAITTSQLMANVVQGYKLKQKKLQRLENEEKN